MDTNEFRVITESVKGWFNSKGFRPIRCETQIIPSLPDVGYGGTADCIAIDHNNKKFTQYIIIDYKTKKTSGKTDAQVCYGIYPDNLMQLAALKWGKQQEDEQYAKALCLDLIVSWDEPGRLIERWLTQKEEEHYLKTFKMLRDFYKQFYLTKLEK